MEERFAQFKLRRRIRQQGDGNNTMKMVEKDYDITDYNNNEPHTTLEIILLLGRYMPLLSPSLSLLWT